MRLNTMGMRLVFVAAAITSVIAIKIPIDAAENRTDTVSDEDSSQKPIYYESDEDKVDSYLVPPNPHRPADISSDEIATPATYLLPPSINKQLDYYKPTESGEQTDWYPIAPAAPPIPRELLPPRQTEDVPIITILNQSEPVFGTFRTGKVIGNDRIIPIPSRSLQPPAVDASNEYVAIPTDDAINYRLENDRAPPRPAVHPLNIWNGPIISVPNNIRTNSLIQVPYNTRKYKNPTKLYPKKYGAPFKPVPIPLAQYADPIIGIPKAKPLKQFKPYQNIETEYRTPSEEKNIYKYEEAQQKGKLKGEHENVKEEEPEISEPNEDVPPQEQETSATNYRIPYRNPYSAPLRQPPNVYSAPLREPPSPAPVKNTQNHNPPADGERTEFRMHGMKGPHSYQFGFDTGKGKNRQFRFEERDNDGHVKGHYGYVDKHGKLRVVNYDADPKHGFRAEEPVESEQ